VAGEGERSPHQALVLNRTSGGLRLAVERAVPVGTTLRLRACNAPPKTPWAEVLVVWCEEMGEYSELGCQFRGQIPWNVLLMFG
jgi:hypothetical protein